MAKKKQIFIMVIAIIFIISLMFLIKPKNEAIKKYEETFKKNQTQVKFDQESDKGEENMEQKPETKAQIKQRIIDGENKLRKKYPTDLAYDRAKHYTNDPNYNKAIEIVNSDQIKTKMKKEIKKLYDPKAFTPQGKFKTFNIDQKSIRLIEGGGIDVYVYVNDDRIYWISCQIDMVGAEYSVGCPNLNSSTEEIAFPERFDPQTGVKKLKYMPEIP